MRSTIILNDGWSFCKEGEAEIAVTLPHTYNAEDGQDGGNDYYRGRGYYKRTVRAAEMPQGERFYLELDGVNSTAEVHINGKHLFTHCGGYSRFRVDITDYATHDFELLIIADNSTRDDIYPAIADFTFYGGIYRDVKIIAVPSTHFDLPSNGAVGLRVLPRMKDGYAEIDACVCLCGAVDGDRIRYTIFDREGATIRRLMSSESEVRFLLNHPHLWHGVRDPYLYRIRAELVRKDEVLDEVEAEFGCRSFSVDPDRGFILNGEEYPLHGVSRHQDRRGIGNALLPKHHEEDIALITELGANAVRAAHYQQSDYFYTLCDRAGLIVWAEIPYISRHSDTATANARTQLSDLILQNINHTSICFWGLSNEITMSGAADGITDTHRMLNALAHSLDPTRLTAIACVSMCDTNEPYITVPDVVAYNHYFGWYGGDTSMNGPWFDSFRKEHPDIPIGVSEYGAEGLDWHSSRPTPGDYTEEYQALYHEELIKQLFSRKYLFATFVWNMFDFGADARCEGGENGINHKGLVTFDRGYKKDAFYAYKAYLSHEPFVHICGKRHVNRAENPTRVTVYSNLDEVELLINGRSIGTKRAADHFFRFEVENVGESRLTARAGDCVDEGTIRYVNAPDPDYIMKEKGAVLNWFDIKERKGYLSLNSTVDSIRATERGAAWFSSFSDTLSTSIADGGDTLRSSLGMAGSFTLLRLTGLLGMMGKSFTKEELLHMNDELTKIPDGSEG